MAYVLKRMYLGYNWVFGDLADPRSMELGLFLMSSPVKPFLIGFAYLYFCQILGPKLMASRKPFQLKKTIMAFNIIQIIMNIHLFYVCLTEIPEKNWTCIPVDYSRSDRGLKHLRYHHLFFLIKMSDLLDTVFFVLRKKNQQISFLHLYHHFGMAMITWFDVKYLGGGHGLWLGVLNCPIHALMYTYYTLSLMDDKWKTNATFKKFLTQVQMLQFLAFIIIYGIPLFMPDCRYPKICSILFVPQNMFMFVLFSDFYRKCYLQKGISNGTSKVGRCRYFKTQINRSVSDMALVLKRIYIGYNHIFADLADPRPVEMGLVFMSTPLWPLFIVGAYLYFCLKLGPKLMENRKPFELKNTMIAFNVAQILVNLYLFYECILELNLTNWSCEPVNYSRGPRFMKIVKLYYVYFLVKLSDFLDTVFFVLRKRNRQVSFLHLYHHFGMFIMMWVAVRFFAGGHGTWLGLFNSLIHAVMYTYYTLAVIDERWKNNLAFKKFITQIQMFQFFAMIVIYGRLLLLPDCQYSKLCSYFFVPQNFFMLILFADFYRKAYLSKKVTATTKNASKND